jgi:AcrR family transcriptional regulator
MTPTPKIPLLRTEEDFPAPPQQARSLEKRKKLLQAGRQLFAEKGYEETSIEDITSRAGTAAGAFYAHFRSKRQFLVVMMNDFLERLSGLVLNPQGGLNEPAGLRKFLAAVFCVDVEYYGVVRAWQEAALSDAEFGKSQKEIEDWTQARILRVFQLLQKSPNARPARDLPGFARMMDRHFWSLLGRGSQIPPKEFGREVGIAADVIYHYLFL